MKPWLLVAIGLGILAWSRRGAGALPGLSAPDRAAVAAADAWRRMLGLPVTATIGVRRVEAHTFADASLGLPEPGRVYSQDLTPGYLVELETTDGRVAEFHCSVSGDCRYCPPCTAVLTAAARG